MKRNNKKGFTIVELVIVIAVIAILAGIMIPTFGSIIDQANQSEALQKGRAYYMEYYAEDITDGVADDNAPTTVLSYTGCEYVDFDDFTYEANGYWAHFNGSDWTTGKGTYN